MSLFHGIKSIVSTYKGGFPFTASLYLMLFTDHSERWVNAMLLLIAVDGSS